MKYKPDEQEVIIAQHREYAAGRIYSGSLDKQLLSFFFDLRMKELTHKPLVPMTMDAHRLIDGIFGASLIIASCGGKILLPQNLCHGKITTDESVLAGLIFFITREFMKIRAECRITATTECGQMRIKAEGEPDNDLTDEIRLAEKLGGSANVLRLERRGVIRIDLPLGEAAGESAPKSVSDYLGNRYSDAYMILSELWCDRSV